jgi:hypothetical protein
MQRELGEARERSSKRARLVEAAADRRAAHGARAGALRGGALGGGGGAGAGGARLALLPLQHGVGSREAFARRSREAVAARLRDAAWRELGGAAPGMRRGMTAVTWAGPDEALLAAGDELGNVALLRCGTEDPCVLCSWTASGAPTHVLSLQAKPGALLVMGERNLAELALGAGGATTQLFGVSVLNALQSAVRWARLMLARRARAPHRARILTLSALPGGVARRGQPHAHLNFVANRRRLRGGQRRALGQARAPARV